MKYKLFILIAIFCLTGFVKEAGATAYYIDFVNGSNGSAGTATTSAWQSLQQFANNARSAGDIAHVRRGVASTTNMSDLTFTTDGTLNNPIIITADYDNLWSDFATSSVTFSPLAGSKYVTTSASTTDAYPSKWIYFMGDCTETYSASALNKCEFAYEIELASSTGISLYLPYKGTQTGSGKTGRIMPSAPQWGNLNSDFQWAMNTDDYWYFKGINIRSTDANCAMDTIVNRGTVIYDMVIEGDGTTDCVIRFNSPSNWIKKTRFFGQLTGLSISEGAIMEDFLADANNVASSVFIGTLQNNGFGYLFKDGEIRNYVTEFSGISNRPMFILLNINLKRNATYNNNLPGGAVNNLYFEDDFSMVGVSSQTSNQISAVTAATTTIRSTANLRAGGGPVNMLVFPPAGTGNTGISTNNFPHSYMKLFEYPIYANTSSKTYSVFFNSTSTAGWSADPTASEFWIECDPYTAVGAHRTVNRSTGVVDFNGSTSWQSLSVTCQPSQAGNIYLRGYYGKPREANGNIFYIDLTPTIQ